MSSGTAPAPAACGKRRQAPAHARSGIYLGVRHRKRRSLAAVRREAPRSMRTSHRRSQPVATYPAGTTYDQGAEMSVLCVILETYLHIMDTRTRTIGSSRHPVPVDSDPCADRTGASGAGSCPPPWRSRQSAGPPSPPRTAIQENSPPVRPFRKHLLLSIY